MRQFDIGAENLSTALNEFARQSQQQILFAPEVVSQKLSTAVRGKMQPFAALKLLLKDSGLKFTTTPSGAILVGDPNSLRAVPTGAPTTSQTASGQASLVAQTTPAPVTTGNSTTTQNQSGPQKESNPSSSEGEKSGLTEIVVTGTNIHNIEPISPTITITGQDMIEQGYSRLDEVFDQLPQNFKGGASQESNGYLNAGNGAANNQFLASGVNLRGLGAGATLVLLNGRRLATTASGASVDISSIPVSVIDRVEILTDGASAIYGSDAVAGVVNIITKQDYSGVETGVRSTGISKGKDADYGGHILGGYSWGSGNFMLNLDGEKNGDLLASNRSFEPSSVPNPFDLLPEQIRRNVYAAVRQDLSSRISLTSDVLVSDRSFTQKGNAADVFGDQSGSAQLSAASLELNFAISPNWNAKFGGQISREKDSAISYPPAAAPDSVPQSSEYEEYKTSSTDAVIDGRLFDLPGGALRMALGGQVKTESLITTVGGYTNPPIGRRSTEAAYGELYIPIVGKENSIPLVQQLNLDVAGRYDHYSDFGSTTNPKVALQWVPIESLTVHATYSKSFRAPLLFDLGAGFGQVGYIYPVTNPASPTGTTTALLLNGSNPDLQPERANSFSTGLAFKPLALPDLKIDLSYFHIDYKDRVDQLEADNFFTNVITNASQLGPLVNLNPTLGQVNELLNNPARPVYDYTNANVGCVVGTPGCTTNPAAIGAIANIGFENVGVATVQGYDIDARYKWDESVGQIFVDFDGTLLTENRIQITPTTVPVNLLNQLNQPLRFRAKMNFGWRKSVWASYGRINFANAYHNENDPNCPELPGCKVSSWTTVDAGISYTIPNENHRLGSGLRIAFDIANVFNRAPPYVNDMVNEGGAPVVPLVPLTYDPLNANPLLRTFAVSVTKAW